MAIRTVLFDLGDTLWHFPELPPADTIRSETMRRIFALLGSWGIKPEGELRFLGRDIRLALGKADREAYAGDLVSPHYPTLVKEVAAAKGLDLDDARSLDLWETWNLGGAFLGRQLLDDALEMLSTLQERGFRLGIVTNRSFGGPIFLEEVKEIGLYDFFEVFAISADLGFMKPHPKIFEHALEALDADPSETAMVGDRLRDDVAGAKALGMTAIWRRPPEPREQVDGFEPDFTVTEMREIPDLPCFRLDAQGAAAAASPPAT